MIPDDKVEAEFAAPRDARLEKFLTSTAEVARHAIRTLPDRKPGSHMTVRVTVEVLDANDAGRVSWDLYERYDNGEAS